MSLECYNAVLARLTTVVNEALLATSLACQYLDLIQVV